jgi:hypothetical protein
LDVQFLLLRAGCRDSKDGGWAKFISGQAIRLTYTQQDNFSNCGFVDSVDVACWIRYEWVPLNGADYLLPLDPGFWT